MSVEKVKSRKSDLGIFEKIQIIWLFVLSVSLCSLNLLSFDKYRRISGFVAPPRWASRRCYWWEWWVAPHTALEDLQQSSPLLARSTLRTRGEEETQRHTETCVSPDTSRWDSNNHSVRWCLCVSVCEFGVAFSLFLSVCAMFVPSSDQPVWVLVHCWVLWMITPMRC